MNKEIIIFGMWIIAILLATHRCLKKAIGNPATLRTLAFVGAILTGGLLVVLKVDSAHAWGILGTIFGFSFRIPNE